MKNLILSKGKVLSKKEQKNIHGGADSSGEEISPQDRDRCRTTSDCWAGRVCRQTSRGTRCLRFPSV
ncbi:hypothetical protein [Tenacibaculum sp. M341]|uniref:hypothetical protein n=1 Tax=Tenacibaculum sp. M341 TaxID=2530339 RepID=UPI001052BB70|nr:hypothetical protein [Tenacibaculum sp. M341]TCI84883.1 hypothetical protein EYW44_19290 [Tenacibaculum sp. M341]